MSNPTNRIPRIDVGTPSPGFQSHVAQEWEGFDVCFHGFEDLPAGRGDVVNSPEFTCLGHQWRLRLSPGGRTDSDDGNVALYLYHRSNESITIQYGFFVKDNHLRERANFANASRCFPPPGMGRNGWGVPNFAKRSDIISALVEGTMVVEVRMRRPDAAGSPPMPFIAENPLSKLLQKKFMDEESADVLFEVGSEKVTTAESKRGKTSPITFHAHSLILQISSPFFAERFESGNDLSKISIPDVTPEIFHHLLYYLYGGEVGDDVLKSNAKDIIDASDKYGVTYLKLKAEAILVASTAITMDNVMELLLYANDKNCALLKETAMDFIVENEDEVVREVSFDNFPGHLTKDVLMAVNMDDSLRVSVLRKRLHEKGLDIDGSREAMIALLEENS